MRTVQITLDDELVVEVDNLAKRLQTSRSAFTRDALRSAIERHTTALLEEQHREGYRRQPVTMEEFSVWEAERAWGDE